MSETKRTEADSVAALSATVSKLRAERDGLRRAMHNRAVIEQAKGILAERYSLDPENAFARLVETSTHNNVKVFELAADIVAGGMTEPPRIAEHHLPEGRTAPISRLEEPDDLLEGPSADLVKLRADLQLIVSRVGAAASFDEITAALATETTGWAAPANVILLLLEADGALRLVGAAGLSVTARSQWDRVPPIQNVPIVAAVHNRAPVYLADAQAVARQFPVVAEPPHDSLVALPLVHEDRVIGVLEFTWAEPLKIDKATRDHLFSIAGPIAQHSALLAYQPESELDPASRETSSIEPARLDLFMASLRRPAALLAPVHGSDGKIIDFRPETVTPAVRESSLAEQLASGGTSLLSFLPGVGSRVLFPAFVEVCDVGMPRQLKGVHIDPAHEGVARHYNVDIHVARFWDRLLVSWHINRHAELLYPSFLLAEEAHDFATFWWEPRSGQSRWSPGMHRLTGVPAQDGPMTMEETVKLIHAEDRDEVVSLVTQTLRQGRRAETEFRGDGPLANRVLTLTAEKIDDPKTNRHGIHAVCRDITTIKELSDHARRSQITAAAQRSHLSDASRVIDDMVAPLSARDDGRLRVTGMGIGPRDQVLGCWYDTVNLPDSSVLLIVGEVHGDHPAATALRLRHAAIGYAVAGMSPAQILRSLNTLCATVSGEETAAVSVARLHPGTGDLNWAVAGQGAPVFFRPDRTANIGSGALSLPIGTAPGIEYHHNSAKLAVGEQLVMYTESLVTRAGAGLTQTFEALLEAAEAATPQQALRRLRERLPDVTATELCLLMVRRKGYGRGLAARSPGQ
jgi:hypothetical protein